jgi:hypothetical protein
MEKTKLEMEFLSSANKKFIIGIDEPRENLTPEEVQTAMEAIIAENVFKSSEADLTEVVGARLVTTRVDKLMM